MIVKSLTDLTFHLIILAQAVVVCTEWDEFVTLDYKRIYNNMNKPAFLFDGRKILDHETLIKYDNSVNYQQDSLFNIMFICRIGFHVETIGKRLHRKNIERVLN